MKMKKLALCMMTVFMLSAFIPTQVKAATKPAKVSIVASKTVESTQAQLLLTRLDKINAMDKSMLTPVEKKQLRKEVRSIQAQLMDISGGVYLSVGAILIIVLVLILLV